MALLTSELRRIRYELGYNVLDAGAEPYIGVAALFETVIQPYMQAGSTTTSATAVAASSSPTPRTLTLTSATGFAQFDRVWVDVDERQESATVSAVSGDTITVLLSNVHSGTYPVTVDGGEAIVREHLAKLAKIANELGDGASGSAGVKQVDEIEFFEGASRLKELHRQREYWRDELASCLGVRRLNKAHGGSGGTIALC